MSDSIKNKITADLQKAKEEGKLRSDRIREIVKTAVSQATSELKEGSTEIRTVVKDAIATVIDNFKGKGDEIQDNITASIEGAIDGISQSKRKTISQTELEVKQLEDQLETEEKDLQDKIEALLHDIQDLGKDKSSQVQTALNSAISDVKDSEEMELLRKRYAQLKAQTAIIRANLVGRYGERFEDVKNYLDDAKVWYEKAKEDPEAFTGKVEQKRQDFEQKLGIAGTAVAQKEQQIKQRLRELWKSMTDLFSSKPGDSV